jgi:glycosyltransferase involved in cell wall biosynthesis
VEQSFSVTVIIDSYNYGHFITQAIDSVLAQNFSEAEREIIVIDDGSTDDTWAKVAEYGDRVTYLRKSNGGQASAFNAGVAAAHGKIVCFLDADDYFYPSKLSRVLEEFSKDSGVGLIYNRYDIVDESGHIISRAMPKHLRKGDLAGRTLLGFVSGSPSSGISVLRSVVSSLSIPEEFFRISADHFYLNILPLVTRVGIVETPLHAYRSHGHNEYLGKTPLSQLEIHSKQTEAIWNYAASVIGKEFFRTTYELEWIGAARSFKAPIKVFTLGVQHLARIKAPLELKFWTLSKMLMRMALPSQMYSWLQLARKRKVHIDLNT